VKHAPRARIAPAIIAAPGCARNHPWPITAYVVCVACAACAACAAHDRLIRAIFGTSQDGEGAPTLYNGRTLAVMREHADVHAPITPEVAKWRLPCRYLRTLLALLTRYILRYDLPSPERLKGNPPRLSGGAWVI
jgi:hypothetical protein